MTVPFREKPRKALPVERLLHWAYAIQRVRGMPAWGNAPGGGTSGALGNVHGDALTIDSLVNQLEPASAALVRDHGVAGTRPDWKPNARPRMAPRAWIEGQEGNLAQWFLSHPEGCGCRGWAHTCSRSSPAVWPRPTKRGRFAERPAAYCPIVVLDDPVELRDFRERSYLVWACALEVMRDALMAGRVRLTDYAVSDVLPPRLPWLVKNTR